LNKDGSIFIPYSIDRDLVKKIEEVNLVKGDKKIAVKFGGLFKEWGGLLLHADPKDISFSADLFNLTSKELTKGEMWFSVTMAEKFGKIQAEASPNRVYRRGKGVRDVVYPMPRWTLRTGTWIVSFDGKLTGIFTLEKKDEDIEDTARDSSMRKYYSFDYTYSPYGLKGRSESESRLFMLSELWGKLAEPSAHFDGKAVPVTKKEEGIRVWLGVEYQSMGKRLAELMNIEKATKDGKQGLLVTHVYPESPAEKLGLKLEDILLSIKVDGKDREIDLTLEGWSSYGPYSSRSPWDYRMLDRYSIVSWRSQKNYLNTLLTEVGEGKKINLKYLRSGEEKLTEIVLERAPVDFEHADKYKDDDLGLTVKELTYEVRAFQKLDKDAAGVVVAKIESGSKAEVAKLDHFAIILKVNGVRVAGLQQFRQQIETWKKTDAKSITLEVLRYGQTRFVDIEK
jgi:hypothetical protein